MSRKAKLNTLSLEKLVGVYQKKQSKDIFEELFTRCHHEMLLFLLRKKLIIDDAEDLLQDYFIHEFERSILRYEIGSQRQFINYVKHIVLLRFFSLTRKKKEEREIQKYSLDANLQSKEIRAKFPTEKSVEEQSFIPLVKQEIKDFFKDIILSIQNEDYRNAIVLKLCLPITLTIEEASDLMGCTTSSYSTWVYRGILELRAGVNKLKERDPFNFQELLHFVKEESFAIKRETLKEINNSSVAKALELFLFLKKEYSELARELNISENEVKALLRKGIFELLSLLNNRELLFRQGGNMPIEKDDVLDFIDHLGESVENEHKGISTRKASTTGDKELDQMLTGAYLLFHTTGYNEKTEQLSSKLLQYIKDNGLTIESIRNEFDLSLSDMNRILMGDDSVSNEVKEKVGSILNLPGDGEVEFKGLGQDRFEKLNKGLLSQYYGNKKTNE